MTPLGRGLLVAMIQIVIVASLGAKFLIDRNRYPRVWAETAPYDPDLPIRGRYVRLAILIDTALPPASGEGRAERFNANLRVVGGRLNALEDPQGRHSVRAQRCGELSCWVLDRPVAYYIPEHAEDPSRRPHGESLWVEVTVPPRGPPRPIRLGVQKGGNLTPIEVR